MNIDVGETIRNINPFAYSNGVIYNESVLVHQVYLVELIHKANNVSFVVYKD